MRTITMTAFAAAALAVASCSTTVEGKPKDIKFSGFLGDYSDLKSGAPGQPAFLYNWGDVVAACKYWSEHTANRLMELGMKPSR